ncbi:MAG: hypothetical protein ABSG94_12905 [Brevinematales bacterium]|jgi:hypothetical protein
MELSSRLQSILSGTIELGPEDLKELKKYFIMDNKGFIKLIDSILGEYKKKDDIENFLYLLNFMHNEFKEISPFVSGNINKVFIIMLKNNNYKQIAQNCDILESCANVRVLELLQAFTAGQKMGKFLTNVEIYKIKKLVLDLSKKYKKDDIVYQIDVDLEKPDNEWLDSIEK